MRWEERVSEFLADVDGALTVRDGILKKPVSCELLVKPGALACVGMEDKLAVARIL